MEEKMFNGLREWIKQVEALGECKVIEGADCNLEIGYITELVASRGESPLLIFDKIKGYKPGYRVVSAAFYSPRRVALTLGLPQDRADSMVNLLKAWRVKTTGGIKPIPAKEVSTGAVKENVHTDDAVDLFEFPTPKWHELDGGRYIGTGNTVIEKDPDEGWVNLGTYRVQVIDKSTVTLHIIGGSHGDLIARKYWDRGLSCPVAIVCGGDPLIWTMSNTDVPWGISEYDYAGWVRGEPVEVVKGETVDLPIPAAAEIVLEGEFISPQVETRIEGPFGEWQGYYGGGARPHPIVRVKAVLHRNDPILLGCPPMVVPNDYLIGAGILPAAALWEELDKQVPGVKGVWYISDARWKSMAVISIKQQYPGHAKQTAMVAASAYRAAARGGKFVIIVDEDIDPSNISEVLWALATRCDPATSIDIIDGCCDMASNPRIPPEKKDRGEFTSSKALIYACKPFSWIEKYPPSIKSRPEILEKVQEKWGKLLF